MTRTRPAPPPTGPDLARLSLRELAAEVARRERRLASAHYRLRASHNSYALADRAHRQAIAALDRARRAEARR